MSDFDPDKYVEDFNPDNYASDFNPDEYLEDKEKKQRADDIRSGKIKFDGSEPESSISDKALSAVAGFGQGATLGFGDEIAGAANAAFGSISDSVSGNNLPWGERINDLLSRYRKARDDAREANQGAQNTSPVSYGLGKIAGGIGVTLAPSSRIASSIKNAGLATQAGVNAAQGAVQGLVQGVGETNHDLDSKDAGRDAMASALLGGVVGGAFPVAARGVREVASRVPGSMKLAAGKLLTAPQKIVDKSTELLGKTEFAKSLGGKADDIGSSRLVQSLRDTVDSSEIADAVVDSGVVNAEELKKVGKEALSSLGPSATKKLNELSQSELKQLFDATSKLFTARGLTNMTPERVESSFAALKDIAQIDDAVATARDFIRITNKRDPKYFVTALNNAGKFANEIIDGEVSAPMQELYKQNAGVHSKMLSGEIDRFGRNPPTQTIPQMRVADIESELAKQPAYTSPPPLPKSQGSTTMAAQKLPLPKLKAKMDEQPFGKPIIDETELAAINKLANMGRGHYAAEQLSPVVGGFAGSALGPLGAAVGIIGGKGAGRNIVQQIGFSNKLGEILEDSGRKSLSDSGKSVIANLSNAQWLRNAAARPDAIGDGARWLMQAGDNETSFAARQFVLSQQPWFRDQLSKDQDTKEPNAQTDKP